jgi:hypothetical protein
VWSTTVGLRHKSDSWSRYSGDLRTSQLRRWVPTRFQQFSSVGDGELALRPGYRARTCGSIRGHLSYTFDGFRNADGSVGTNNILGITTTVQCVAPTVEYAVTRITKPARRG